MALPIASVVSTVQYVRTASGDEALQTFGRHGVIEGAVTWPLLRTRGIDAADSPPIRRVHRAPEGERHPALVQRASILPSDLRRRRTDSIFPQCDQRCRPTQYRPPSNRGREPS